MAPYSTPSIATWARARPRGGPLAQVLQVQAVLRMLKPVSNNFGPIELVLNRIAHLRLELLPVHRLFLEQARCHALQRRVCSTDGHWDGARMGFGQHRPFPQAFLALDWYVIPSLQAYDLPCNLKKMR